MLASIHPLSPRDHAETVETFDALGRILAQDLRSPLDVPGADNASMDGYALRASDVAAPGAVLPVSQRIAAGHPGQPLAAGTAARIFTGAWVPPGADAVVMQEQCEPVAAAGAGPDAVRVQVAPEPGQWIRRRGEDIQRGAVVLQQGLRLTPQALGLAAAVGCASLPVMRRLRVAVLSTGDELVMPGAVAPQDLPPGTLYNSNRHTLRGLLQALGCEVTDLGVVPDQLEATCHALEQAAHAHDAIVTSGGVSVGEEDHIRPALRALGEVVLWQMAIKPGKPLAFGRVNRRDGSHALFYGLPGNPVSAFITFGLLVRPGLLRLSGGRSAEWPRLQLPAGFSWPKPDRRREFLRVRMGADGRLALFPNQSSGVLTSTVWADGLVDNPPGQVIEPGQLVDYIPLTSLWH